MKTLLLIIALATTQLLQANSLQDALKKLTANAPDPGERGITVALPGTPSEVKPAFYGVYALYKFKDSNKLSVLNLAQAKIQHTLQLKSSDYIFASGGSTLVVLYPKISIVEVYSLANFKKVKVKKLAIGDRSVINMEMATLNGSRLLLTGAGKEIRFYAVLDLGSFKVTELPPKNFEDDIDDNVQLRLDKSFTKILSWRPRMGPTGFYVIPLTNNTGYSQMYLHEDYGALNFSNSEKSIITSSGKFISPEGQKIMDHDCICVPLIGASAYLSVSGNYVTVRDLNSHIAIHTFKINKSFENTEKPSKTEPNMTHDREIIASKLSGNCLITDKESKKATIYSLCLNGSTGEGQPPIAKVNQLWSYDLGVPDQSEVIIHSGPEGLSYSKGKLSWTAEKPGWNEVLLSVKQEGKSEYYKSFIVWASK